MAISRDTLTVKLPLFVWAALMFTVSSLPGDKLPNPGLFGWDKIAHSIEYVVLATLLWRYVRTQWRTSAARTSSIVLGVGILLGALDELHQIPIPLRTCSAYDFLADALGVGAGIVIMRLTKRDR